MNLKPHLSAIYLIERRQGFESFVLVPGNSDHKGQSLCPSAFSVPALLSFLAFGILHTSMRNELLQMWI